MFRKNRRKGSDVRQEEEELEEKFCLSVNYLLSINEARL